MIFETPRLILRRFTEEDAPLIYELTSDPEILKYVHEAVLKNEAQAKTIIANIILPQYKLNLGRWAIHTKADNQFIGWCGLKYIEKTGITDLGYRLLKKEWGKGYATEAARYTLNYGLKDLGIEVITGIAQVDNSASINVLEKLGMRFMRTDVVDENPVKIYEITLANFPDFVKQK